MSIILIDVSWMERAPIFRSRAFRIRICNTLTNFIKTRLFNVNQSNLFTLWVPYLRFLCASSPSRKLCGVVENWKTKNLFSTPYYLLPAPLYVAKLIPDGQ